MEYRYQVNVRGYRLSQVICICSQVGSAYWAVRTTLCSSLRSDAEQLPYQAGMQPGRMLSMVQLYNPLRIWEPMPNLLRGKRCCRALFMTVLVCLGHDSLLVMWTPKDLQALNLLHYITVDEKGGVLGPPFPVILLWMMRIFAAFC